MGSSRAERVGRNEALFREVNERIKDLTWGNQDAEFLCECGDETCVEPLHLTLDEYESVRRDPRHFLVVPGHEIEDLERVVATGETWLTVEKLPGRPAQVATDNDPRA